MTAFGTIHRIAAGLGVFFIGLITAEKANLSINTLDKYITVEKASPSIDLLNKYITGEDK